MSLTDFLLARIAEDEEAARWPIELRERWGDDPVDHEYRWAWHTSHRGTGGQGTQFLTGAPSPDRVLAECESKRRIVQADWRADDSGEATLIREDVLRALAAVYASHRDYDPSWSA